MIVEKMAIPDDSREGRARRKRIFDRHAQAARDGVHLPSVRELLRGMPFFADSLERDAQAWSERILPRLRGDGESKKQIAAHLERLSVSPMVEDFDSLRDAMRAMVDSGDYESLSGLNLHDSVARLEYYAASFGSGDACIAVARRALRFAAEHDVPSEASAALYELALGWLSVSSDVRPRHRSRTSNLYEDSIRRDVESRGCSYVAEIIVASQTSANDMLTEQEVKESRRVMRGNWTRPTMAEAIAAAEGVTLEPVDPKGAAIVIPTIGDPDTTEGRLISAAYSQIVGKPLPLTMKPSIHTVRQTLTAEFPHAFEVIERVVQELEGSDYVRLRYPIVFVGNPGCGKTTLAGRLLDALGVRFQMYSCAGVADSSFAGTPRQWSTGNPSLPVSLVRRHHTASPGVVLDEISRAAEGRRNGNLLDALLGMWEPESARRWFDPYLSAAVDLSRAVWLATCNSLESVPAALRDRCIVMRVPDPAPEHLEALGNKILRKAIAEKGMPEAWALPLDGTELSALAGAWQGGSLRGLRRLIDGVLSARDIHPGARA